MRTTRRRVLVAAAVTLTVTAATAAVLSWVGRSALVLSVDGDTIGLDRAHVGTVYNFGVRLENDGDDDVRVESARIVDLPAGLRAETPLLGLCSLEHGMPIVDVGADLARNNGPTVMLVPLGSRAVRPRSVEPLCSYVLLRVTPTEIGNHVAHDVTIRFRSGWRTFTKRVQVTFELPTTLTGPDPRDKVAPLDENS